MSQQPNEDNDTISTKQEFEAIENPSLPPDIKLPDEQWESVLATPCTFPPDIFTTVMFNLIQNPNVTSSHLFRADIFYDSDTDRRQNLHNSDRRFNHLKPEYRPVGASWPGFEQERTIVRQLVPRNPQLDAPLIQTCHFFTASNPETDNGDACREYRLVLYIPHVHKEEEMPFYHPLVSQLAFLHSFQSTSDAKEPGVETGRGTLTLLYRCFANTENSLNPKLLRTGLRLLQTTHKHGQGQLGGYRKRVHLDRVLPQKRFQDTYTRLKTTYARPLVEQWVEVTDPGKHVFEDLAIAAFLVELWRDMYTFPQQKSHSDPALTYKDGSKKTFPGFVDIGCGNGLLVYILIQEGYWGWGFDARERKTWSTFPESVRQNLQQRILVPSVFHGKGLESDSSTTGCLHEGIFEPGTFIISNHADELTAWTPLLGYLNSSAFIAIPCCSHDLSGARGRLPAASKATAETTEQTKHNANSEDGEADARRAAQVAETGSLQRTIVHKKMASAYSTLCSYVASLAEEVGFVAETEILRIPSTRNHCIVGRKVQTKDHVDSAGKAQVVCEIVERELKKSIAVVATEWVERAEKLAQKPGSGH